MISAHVVCNSWKQEVQRGIHQETDTYKLALIKTGQLGTYDENITNYSDLGTDEVTGVGYTAGGQDLVGFATGLAGSIGYTDWTTDPSWPSSTFAADGCLIYNFTQGGRAVAIYGFSNAPVISNNGTFTAPIPPPGATAVVRIA